MTRSFPSRLTVKLKLNTQNQKLVLVRLKLSVTLRDVMECGGKRSATPLWLVFVPYPSQDEPLKPKRRRASLAAALHIHETRHKTRSGSQGLSHGRGRCTRRARSFERDSSGRVRRHHG